MVFQSADAIKSYFAAKLPNARPLAVWKGMEYVNIDKDDEVSRLPLANDAIITALVCTQNLCTFQEACLTSPNKTVSSEPEYIYIQYR